MCLVISVLLLVLSVNFYLDGFVIQAVVSGIIAAVLMFIVGRGISCSSGSCKIINKEDEADDN